MIIDLEGYVIFLNEMFTELTGYDSSDLLGLVHYEALNILLRKDKLPNSELIDAFEHACQGIPFSAKRKFYHKTGYTLPINMYETQLCDKWGEPTGVLLIVKDWHSEFMVMITNLVNSSLEISQVLNNVTQVVVEHLDLSSNAIFLYDSFENILRLVSCNVFTPEELEKVVIPLGEGAPGIIAQTRKPLYIANLHEDPLIHEVGHRKHHAKSSIGFPLICREQLLGVIAFDAESIRTFSDREIAQFESIAGQVALAVYNARLFSQLEHLSITDGLTGAYNHRYFQEKLNEALDDSQQQSNPLSLLFLDLDFFKNYNDTFGHPKGDELLKDFTQVLKEVVRQSDLVFRYGGEEFAILLHNCPMHQAKQIAERIREACEKRKFYGIDTLPRKKITVSIGVACYPEIQNSKELIIKADQALYQAKLSRNCVTIAV